MKYKIFLLFTSFIISSVYTQTVEDAWVFFTGKPQADSYLNNPLNMLSQRAIDRRERLNIDLDELDVPVDEDYLQQISTANGIVVKAKSKWLNAVHVQGSEEDIRNLFNFDFVDYLEFANKNIGTVSRQPGMNFQTTSQKFPQITYDYGNGYDQIHLLNGELMHEQDFTGKGILLAVIDAGFIDVNTDDFFQHLFQDNKVIDVYNFVGNDENVYQYHSHGASVLSTIAGKSEGELVGTAPDVSVALYVSEDVSQEMPIEESYWAEAAERADSIGVDVINTSLGYQTYDRDEYSYTMDDLDGKTSFISRAAEIAVSRGIVVVVSAGNSGNTSWPKIAMPADAVSVITVGAVDVNREKASFSSVGPTADGRIKPDVMAQGVNATAYSVGSFHSLSGTSLSSPIIAGMTACMRQAYPDKTPAEIKQDLISISDRSDNPDNEYGYGIPDFSLYETNHINKNDTYNIDFYPNPAHQKIYLTGESTYKLFTADGKMIKEKNTLQNHIDINGLSKGIYYLSLSGKTFKLIVE